jgi:hypothetical protein
MGVIVAAPAFALAAGLAALAYWSRSERRESGIGGVLLGVGVLLLAVLVLVRAD